MNSLKGRREIIVSATVVFLLAAIPITLTPFPPTTDLPQHINQVLLAIKHAGDPSGPYLVLWGAPNTLVYGFIFLLERVFSLEFLGRAILLFMIAIWIFAIFYTAERKKRPVEAAVLASLFLFNIAFYWGFLNFLVGFPVFVAWFFLTVHKEPDPPGWWYLLLVLTSFLLYGSHVLWFLVGAAWLGLISLLRQLPLRVLVFRSATLMPVALAVFFWYRKYSAFQAASGLNESPEWVNHPFKKLFSFWFRDQAFGGGTGLVETILFFLILAWAAFSLWSNRRDLRRTVDVDLMTAAALVFAICFFAPDRARNTIGFSGRWVPVCFIFLFLALPAPRLNSAVRRAFSWGAVVVFFLATTFQWVGFERKEMTGFAESLARIPRASRVLGLDYVKESRYFQYRPFLQMYAYAQVFSDAELSFPFPRHATGLVAFRRPFSPPWTLRLDWYAERVRETDFDYFDYILVNGSPYDHNHRLPRRRLTPVTTSGRWRLYRVETTVPAAALPE